MHSFRSVLTFILTAALFISPAVASRAHSKAKASISHTHAARSGSRSAHAAPSIARASKGKGRGKARKSHTLHGQLAIAPERVTEIQQALIREHYLNGDADGQWDSTTQAAMQKYQADQGWQTKLMPDSRALKKLGLGPDYSGAINAKTASFGAPPPVSTIPAAQVAGFSAGSGVDRTNR